MRSTRRRFLAAALAGAHPRWRPRLAICNETFEGAAFSAACRMARQAGFEGIEIAPFTLAEDPATLTREQRRELSRTMASEGIRYAGLHAFLSAPKGLHLTGPDEALRRRSWDFFRRMIDFGADLGEDSVLVFGSGRQRAATGGVSVKDATDRIREGLAKLAPHAEARKVKVLLEPLAPHLCNVVTSLAEAVAIVREIGSPAVQTVFDTHNAVNETEDHGDLIRKYRQHIFHVHLNEMDGRHPGTGNYDFRPVLRALAELRFEHWVSVEVFDFKAGGERIAKESIRHLNRLLELD